MSSFLSIIRPKIREPGERRHLRTVALVILLAMVSAGIASTWGLPDGMSRQTTSSWAVDTIAPLGPLNEAKHGFTRAGIDDVIYPLFHYVVLAGAYAPYIGVQWLTGEFQNPSGDYPYGAQSPERFFKHLTWIAGIVSTIMFGGILIAVYLTALELFDRRAALWATILAALIPPLSFYGATSNLDVPYLFWTMLAIWQLVRAARTGRFVAFVLCGVFASLATATKDQAVGFFLALPVVVPWLLAQRRARDGASTRLVDVLTDRRAIGAACAALLTFALANNLLFGGWDGFTRHLGFADTFYAANIATKEVPLIARQPQILLENAALLIEMVGIPLLLLAALGFWHARRERIGCAWLIVVPSLTYYVFILAPTNSISRYLLGIALLLAPFAGLAVARALETAARVRKAVVLPVAAMACIWQGSLLYNLHLSLRHDSRYAMADWVRTHVPPGAVIESATQARYLPRLADRYRYAIVGNSFDAIDYSLRAQELTTTALAARDPDYVMVLANSGLSGDPARLRPIEPAYRYFADLLEGRAGYAVVAEFATPTHLPFRQLTVGTQPTTILLRRNRR
jgi:4-amino-4-deoxy-L-arabinose transferase-like glycosyltransferase